MTENGPLWTATALVGNAVTAVRVGASSAGLHDLVAEAHTALDTVSNPLAAESLRRVLDEVEVCELRGIRDSDELILNLAVVPFAITAAVAEPHDEP